MKEKIELEPSRCQIVLCDAMSGTRAKHIRPYWAAMIRFSS